jgi:hypothetical protein
VLVENSTPSALALLCLREDRPYLERVAAGEPVDAVYPPRSGFCGFHVKDLFRKVFRRLLPRRRVPRTNVSDRRDPVRIPFGPYGGLFFHREVLVRIGPPDERFHIYCDDNEFTYRLTRSGGSLYLVPASLVRDIDDSWHIKTKEGSFFSRLLRAESGLRVYYSIRNQVYFERQNWTDHRIVYTLNKWWFLGALWCWSRVLNRRHRASLIFRAVRDGEADRLGTVEDLASEDLAAE